VTKIQETGFLKKVFSNNVRE